MSAAAPPPTIGSEDLTRRCTEISYGEIGARIIWLLEAMQEASIGASGNAELLSLFALEREISAVLGDDSSPTRRFVLIRAGQLEQENLSDLAKCVPIHFDGAVFWLHVPNLTTTAIIHEELPTTMSTTEENPAKAAWPVLQPLAEALMAAGNAAQAEAEALDDAEAENGDQSIEDHETKHDQFGQAAAYWGACAKVEAFTPSPVDPFWERLTISVPAATAKEARNALAWFQMGQTERVTADVKNDHLRIHLDDCKISLYLDTDQFDPMVVPSNRLSYSAYTYAMTALGMDDDEAEALDEEIRTQVAVLSSFLYEASMAALDAIQVQP